jgi:hypothetical protein
MIMMINHEDGRVVLGSLLTSFFVMKPLKIHFLVLILSSPQDAG